MDVLDEITSRFFELTRDADRRLGLDDGLVTARAEALDQLRYEVLAEPDGVAVWAHWTDRKARSGRLTRREGRSSEIRAARTEELFAETDALLADTRAWKAENLAS